jgi:hypothetical protein
MAVVEAVGMRLVDPLLGLDEDEREGIEAACGAEPDVARRPGVEVGLEGVGVGATHRAIDSVGGDNQVGIETWRGQVGLAHLVMEAEVHAEGGGAPLEEP